MILPSMILLTQDGGQNHEDKGVGFDGPDIGCGLAALVHRNAIGDRVVIRRHDLQALENDFAKACSALRNPVQSLSEIGGRLVSRPG